MRINDVLGMLIAAYTDWNHLLANPRFVRKGRIITWRDYSSAMIVIPQSHLEVVQLYEDGQYSFQTTDGSLLQIYYAYARSGDELQEARLAFYKVDAASWDRSESAENPTGAIVPEDKAPLGEQLAQDRVSVPWLRIDYEPKNAGGILHNSCHLHISCFPQGRLTVAGVPTPKQFVEFVVAMCYPDVYSQHRLDDRGNFRELTRLEGINSDCVPFHEDHVIRHLTHLRIPGVLAPRTAERRARR